MLTYLRIIVFESIKRVVLFTLASIGVFVVITFISYIIMPLISDIIDEVNAVFAPILMCLSFYAFLVYFFSRDKEHIKLESTNENGINKSRYRSLSIYYCVLSFISFLIYEIITLYIVYIKGYGFLRSIAVPSLVPMLIQNSVIAGFVLSLVLFAVVLFFTLIAATVNVKVRRR